MTKRSKAVSHIQMVIGNISINGKSVTGGTYSRIEYSDGTVKESNGPVHSILEAFAALAGELQNPAGIQSSAGESTTTATRKRQTRARPRTKAQRPA